MFHAGQTEKFPCKMCEYNGTSRKHLNLHLRNVHLSHLKDTFRCLECKFETKYGKGALDKHMKVKHSTFLRKDHKCEYCSYQSALRIYLNRHIKRMHKNITDSISIS